MTFKYWSGFSSLTLAIVSGPCSTKSACIASMKASPSLFREPFGRPAMLPDSPGFQAGLRVCSFGVETPSASASLIRLFPGSIQTPGALAIGSLSARTRLSRNGIASSKSFKDCLIKGRLEFPHLPPQAVPIKPVEFLRHFIVLGAGTAS